MLKLCFLWCSLKALGAGLAKLLDYGGQPVPARSTAQSCLSSCQGWKWNLPSHSLCCQADIPLFAAQLTLVSLSGFLAPPLPSKDDLIVMQKNINVKESLEVIKSSPCLRQSRANFKMRSRSSGSCLVEIKNLQRLFWAWWRHMEKSNVLHREGITMNCLCQKSHPVKCSLLKQLGERTALSQGTSCGAL